MNDILTSHHTYKTWQQATFDPCDGNYVTVTTLHLL